MFAATFLEEAIFSTLYMPIISYQSLLVSYAWMHFWAFFPLHGSIFLLSFQWYDFLWDKLKLINVTPILFFFLKNILLTYCLSWHLVNYFKGIFFNFYGNSHWNFERQLCNMHISFIGIENLVTIFCLWMFNNFPLICVSFGFIYQCFIYTIFIHC